MRPGDLDDRYLPRAAAQVGGLARRFDVRRTQLAALLRDVRAGSLRDLDARYAGSGPLALMRDVPQVGFVLIAAVFLAGAGSVVSQENARNRAAQQQAVAAPRPGASASPTLVDDSSLGPQVGEVTATYEAAADRALKAAAAGSPSSGRIALVSFDSYLGPDAAAALLNGFTVRRVYLRAKAAGAFAAQLPVDIKGDLLGDLQKVYRATALARTEAQKSFQGYADSVAVTSKQEQDFKDDYLRFATSTGIEAREYRNACACVYSAVVEAKAGQLPALRTRAGVRAVEVSGPDRELGQLLVLPLLPEVKGVVRKQQAGVVEQP